MRPARWGRRATLPTKRSRRCRTDPRGWCPSVRRLNPVSAPADALERVPTFARYQGPVTGPVRQWAGGGRSAGGVLRFKDLGARPIRRGLQWRSADSRGATLNEAISPRCVRSRPLPAFGRGGADLGPALPVSCAVRRHGDPPRRPAAVPDGADRAARSARAAGRPLGDARPPRGRRGVVGRSQRAPGRGPVQRAQRCPRPRAPGAARLAHPPRPRHRLCDGRGRRGRCRAAAHPRRRARLRAVHDPGRVCPRRRGSPARPPPASADRSCRRLAHGGGRGGGTAPVQGRGHRERAPFRRPGHARRPAPAPCHRAQGARPLDRGPVDDVAGGRGDPRDVGRHRRRGFGRVHGPSVAPHRVRGRAAGSGRGHLPPPVHARRSEARRREPRQRGAGVPGVARGDQRAGLGLDRERPDDGGRPRHHARALRARRARGLDGAGLPARRGGRAPGRLRGADRQGGLDRGLLRRPPHHDRVRRRRVRPHAAGPPQRQGVAAREEPVAPHGHRRDPRARLRQGPRRAVRRPEPVLVRLPRDGGPERGRRADDVRDVALQPSGGLLGPGEGGHGDRPGHARARGGVHLGRPAGLDGELPSPPPERGRPRHRAGRRHPGRNGEEGGGGPDPTAERAHACDPRSRPRRPPHRGRERRRPRRERVGRRRAGRPAGPTGRAAAQRRRRPRPVQGRAPGQAPALRDRGARGVARAPAGAPVPPGRRRRGPGQRDDPPDRPRGRRARLPGLHRRPQRAEGGPRRPRRVEGRGRGGHAGEVGVPGHHVARDPHAHERGHRDDLAPGRDRARRRPGGLRPDHPHERGVAADGHQRHLGLLEGGGRSAHARRAVVRRAEGRRGHRRPVRPGDRRRRDPADVARRRRRPGLR